MLRTTRFSLFCPACRSCPHTSRKNAFAGCSSSISSSKGFLGKSRSLREARLQGTLFRRDRPLEICCGIADTRKLSPLPLENLLTDKGTIHSNEEETTRASVFAIFDQNKKLQYIGFSKGLRDSLRTVFARRPDKAYYFKSVNLTKLDQKEMVSIRDAWFEEVGGPPAGNKRSNIWMSVGVSNECRVVALERAAWQQPLDVGDKVTSSKLQAAEERAQELIQQIKDRGCTEEFLPNPDVLPLGQVDLVLVDSMTEEEIAEKKAKMEAINKATCFAKAMYREEETEFSVYFKQEILTNGGTIFDVVVSHDNEDTSHRIIVGDEYYAPHNLQPRDVVMQAFAFVIEEELERQTEGLLLMTQFPINYFTVADLDQRFPEYREHFKRWTGVVLTGDKFWRFMRTEDYGPVLEQLEGYQSPLPKYGETPLLTGYE